MEAATVEEPTPSECRSGYFVGCSGWHYPDWRGIFYPPGMPASRWLSYYSQTFNTVEINTSFYSLPKASTVDTWRNSVSGAFLFAVKGSRFITHVKRLAVDGATIEKFTTQVSGLNDRLGPVLWQLPPSLHRDAARLESFLSRLPAQVRHVVEFRHESWWYEETYDLLRAHRAAICLIDSPVFRSPLVRTTDLVYIRFHGASQMYSGPYPATRLRQWATNLRGIADAGTSLFAYFNNDVGGHAINDALQFRELLAAP